MKALVLAGGFPQIDLILKLKKRGYFVILADYNKNPIAKEYADKFYQVSTLDVHSIKQLAIEEEVKFLITVCTDQALLTVAKVSEELGLPCYIDYETALKVTNKSYMKEKLVECGVPTAKYMVFSNLYDAMQVDWKYPVVVKPVDCNSSKGVKKVDNPKELETFFQEALEYSRTHKALVEEFISGEELSIDVYVEDGLAKILDITISEKINDEGRFVIFRTWHSANISSMIYIKICELAQRIADEFKIVNSPMLIQLLSDGREVYVLEFSARTGGGVKFLSIERQTGTDIISAVIDLTEGKKPIIKNNKTSDSLMLDEYIYCKKGVFDHIEGFDESISLGNMLDYYIFKWRGFEFDRIENSGDRLAGFTIVADTLEELKVKHRAVNDRIKAISLVGDDIIRHDLLKEII